MSSVTSKGSTLEFKNISLGGRVATVYGVLTISGEADKAFSWKALSTSGVEDVKRDKLKSLDWMFTTRGHQLRVWKVNDEAVEFVGFEEEDFQRLNAFVMTYFSDLGVTMSSIDINAEGKNWGKPTFKGNYMIFKEGDRESFEISLPDVKNAQKLAKNSELILEFHDDDTASKTDDCLVELRLIVPDAASNEDDNEEDGEIMTVDSIHKTILNKAEIATDTGEAIATFSNLSFVTPRGTYNVDLYRKFLRLHGRTYAFKILYKSISTLFLLPKPGGTHMYFVISLDTPIRQGQKPYPHLVLNFAKSDNFDKDEPLALKMDKKEIEEKYKDKNLKRKMDGPVFEVVAKVFRALTGRKLIGAGKFSNYSSDKAIKCSYKAFEGCLFFLEKSIFFLHKPTIYVRHEEIKSLKFQRADSRAGGSRFFDLAVILKAGGKPHIFSNINKNEYEGLVEFIQQKGLVIDNIIQQQSVPDYTDDNDDSDEDDDDFAAEDVNEEEDDAEFEMYTTSTQASEEVADGGDGTRGEKRKASSSGEDGEKTAKKPKK